MPKKFDHVIGNPPYIRIQNLEKTRDCLKDWKCMAGNADLCLLFFELGFKLLCPGGKLLYIAPSSWLRNNAGRALRDLITENHNIKGIWDFGEYQVFEDVDAYVAIVEIEAETEQEVNVPAWKWEDGELQPGKARLSKDGWQSLASADAEFMAGLDARDVCLADVADINVGIQTHADSVFIFDKNELDIEPGIVRKAYKVSSELIEKYAIYPYKDGVLIPESVLAGEYPKAYAYLAKNKSKLMERDKGKFPASKWYGYGRQFMVPVEDKLLTPNMSDIPNFKLVKEPDALFYGGYSVKLKSGGDLEMLMEELNGDDMERFIRLTSQPFKSGWYSYNKTYISKYRLKNFN